MQSHTYAAKLKDLAEFLLSKPEFKVGTRPYFFSYQYTKEDFILAVRSLGAGTKEFTDTQIKFKPTDMPVGGYVEAPRDKVCTLVKAAVWDCEPLLSASELEEAGK